MREKVLSFDELAGKIHQTQVCEKTFFQYLVAAGKQYKIRPNGDDGWGTITLLCREYSNYRYYPKAQALAAVPEGTISGPVLEVHFVKILDRYVIEVAIPSIANPMDTSYVVISRETALNEIHDHKEGLKSSDELLRRSDFYEGGTSIIKETCASPLSIPLPRASLYTQRTIAANDWKWKVIHAHSSNGGYLAVAVSMMVQKMLRHYDKDERQTDGSRHWDTIEQVLLKAFPQDGARDFEEGFWLH